MPALDAYPGKARPVLKHVEEHLPADPLAEHHGVARVAGRLAELAAEHRVWDARHPLEQGELAPASGPVVWQLRGNEFERERRPVRDQHPSVSIDDLAARGLHPDLADPVVPGESPVVVA